MIKLLFLASGLSSLHESWSGQLKDWRLTTEKESRQKNPTPSAFSLFYFVYFVFIDVVHRIVYWREQCTLSTQGTVQKMGCVVGMLTKPRDHRCLRNGTFFSVYSSFVGVFNIPPILPSPRQCAYLSPSAPCLICFLLYAITFYILFLQFLSSSSICFPGDWLMCGSEEGSKHKSSSPVVTITHPTTRRD